VSSRTEAARRHRARRAGVFYTHDDVTAYIAERTILPRLLDMAAANCPDGFRPDGDVWKRLAEEPDRYIPPDLCDAPEMRRRHLALRQRLRSGKAASVNDLVTRNLDIARWVTDVVHSAGPSVRAALTDAAASITVLDPTCGDGAFLKAALRVLEGVLPSTDGVAIRRSILANNLFGVDLRREAVVECRRNLLALLTELEPSATLPDLSENIQCGNALKLDWDAAFASILRAGGFDVIIGNPPYIAADRAGYRVRNFRTSSCPDVYAWVLERAVTLLRAGGRCGMIVPLSLAFSGDFALCRKLLFAEYECNWFSSFGRIPAALFASNIRVRNVIHLAKQGHSAPQTAYTTRLHRWFEEERPQLLPRLDYAPFNPNDWQGRVPKLGSARLLERFAELRQRPARLRDCLSASPTTHALYYKQTAYNWLTFCRHLPPCFDETGQPCSQTQFDVLFFRSAWQRDAAMLLLNGKWMFAYWIAVGDDFHVARWIIADFPIDLEKLSAERRKQVSRLALRLEHAMERAVSFKRNAGKRVGTYNLARCRKVTDQSDQLFARLLGSEDVWEDVESLCSQVVKTDFTTIEDRR
jgi:hypothetical protein